MADTQPHTTSIRTIVIPLPITSSKVRNLLDDLIDAIEDDADTDTSPEPQDEQQDFCKEALEDLRQLTDYRDTLTMALGRMLNLTAAMIRNNEVDLLIEDLLKVIGACVNLRTLITSMIDDINEPDDEYEDVLKVIVTCVNPRTTFDSMIDDINETDDEDEEDL